MTMKKVKGMQFFKNDLNNNTSLTSNIELRIWFILLLTLLQLYYPSHPNYNLPLQLSQRYV
ncbi:MAG: hypothetical protein ACJAZT_000644 [Gammaproteobacteria bacterium]|jgi:hypothetical protein